MKNFFFAIVAMFLLLGVSPNVIAQNPVKKVKYLKHVYEGVVNKKKVPEGKGTMTFEGFTVTGDFMGNEVTNATLSINNSDITYNGNLSFDESQNVTLKSGGKIQVIVYPIYDEHHGRELKGESYVLETISSEKLVNKDDFIFNEYDFSYTTPVKWEDNIKQTLDPPAIAESFQLKAVKIRIRYRELGSMTVWDLSPDGYSPSLNEKIKYIFALRDKPEKHPVNVDGYKDDKGRMWTYNKDSVKVVYPNGSYFVFDTEDVTKIDESDGYYRPYIVGKTYKFKIIRPDNIVITNGWGCGKCNFYNRNQEIIAQVPCDIGSGMDVEKILALMDTTQLLCLPDGLFSSDPVIYNSENLSDKDIENIFNNQVFSKYKYDKEVGKTFGYNYRFKLPSNYKHLEWVKMAVIHKNTGEEIGWYFFKDRNYLSKSQLIGDDEREGKEGFDKLLAQLDPIKKRFGFNPLDRGIRDIVKVGVSFKLISDYFKLTKKYYHCYHGNGESFKREFPGEKFVDLRFDKLREMADEKKISQDYYYTNLSIDHGARKCYDISCHDAYGQNRKIGYVWISGDRISTVVWR